MPLGQADSFSTRRTPNYVPKTKPKLFTCQDCTELKDARSEIGLIHSLFRLKVKAQPMYCCPTLSTCCLSCGLACGTCCLIPGIKPAQLSGYKAFLAPFREKSYSKASISWICACFKTGGGLSLHPCLINLDPHYKQ